MTSWKRAMGMAAMFVAMACVSFAAEGAAPGGAGGAEARAERAKQLKAATTIVDKYVAKEAGLAGEKAEKFVTAMASERDSFQKKMDEARKAGGGGAGFGALMQERTKGIEAVVDANMTGDQAKKAKEILGFSLENSIAALIGAKVEPAKIDQAMPILLKYGKATAALRAKMQSNELSAEDMRTKSQELRAATAKDLEPVVGKEGATAFQEARGMMGMGGGRGGKKKAE